MRSSFPLYVVEFHILSHKMELTLRAYPIYLSPYQR